MASKPLGENELRNLIERRRWGDGTKIYTRRIFRARRNNPNGCSAAADTVSATTNVCKHKEERNLPNGDAPEKSSQALADVDDEFSQSVPAPHEKPEAVFQAQGSERVELEEGDSCDGTAEQIPECKETVDTLGKTEKREATELSQSRDSLLVAEGSGGEVEPGRRETGLEPESRETVVGIESREIVIGAESGEPVLGTKSGQMVADTESREIVMDVDRRDAPELPEKQYAPELPEELDALELTKRREMVLEMEKIDAAELPESREMEVNAPKVLETETIDEAKLPDSREMEVDHDTVVEVNPETVVEMERTDALELPERRDMLEVAESREMEVDLENQGMEVDQDSRVLGVDSGGREMVIEPEIRAKVFASEGRANVAKPEEIKNVAEPEFSESVAELKGGESVAELESREDAESRESLSKPVRELMAEPECRELIVEPQHREMVAVEDPESGATVFKPQRRETTVELESNEMVVAPESRNTVGLDQGRREVVESEYGELGIEPESKDILMEPETVTQPESREMLVLEQEIREVVVPSRSREVVRVPPESREMVVPPESREVVVPPFVNGNGVLEENGVSRLRQQCPPQLLEVRQGLPVVTRIEDRVRINVSGSSSVDEIRELRRELGSELDQVRSLFKKLETKELQLTAYTRSSSISNKDCDVGVVNGNINNYAASSFGGADVCNFGGHSQPQYMSNDIIERRALMRVNSDMGSVGHQETRPYSRSLSVSVVENNHGTGEFVEREKRTPKANQFYRNSEFLLGKDRLPPESNKKLKPNGTGRKYGGEGNHGFGFGYDKQQRELVFRSCSSLLLRLMKHEFGWVFNAPVDAKRLGLHDYHDIVKQPMDLGTIKGRLSRNFYRSPKEFVEDVRLVFHNAMMYNPKGQDVHIMAETLLKIFEERWAVIQTENSPDWRYQMYHDAGLPTPISRRPPPTQFYNVARATAPAPVPAPAPITVPVTPVPQTRTLDRSESISTSVDPKGKPPYFAHVGRTPVLKKPKAKEPNKRDMTYEEKQKLSKNLQSLPSEKLDAIVQIIKKRNSTLNQHDDEIEVDIDNVDAETLWELDRFVTNYRKNLSKNKRKAEISLQARPIAAQTILIPMMNTAPAVVDVQNENRIGENNAPPLQVEKQGDHVSRSSSSSSSSSDSGSSSSDSDSDSSSANGSDGG